MANKKKQTTINNIEQLNIDINYEKLAEAIAKALRKSDSSELASKQQCSFWTGVRRIIKGEKSSDGRFLTAPLAIVLSIVFRFLAVICLLILPYALISFVSAVVQLPWQWSTAAINIVWILISVALMIIIFLFFVMLWGAANDIAEEKDKTVVLGLFSAIVSTAALVVAVIALKNGIG